MDPRSKISPTMQQFSKNFSKTGNLVFLRLRGLQSKISKLQKKTARFASMESHSMYVADGADLGLNNEFNILIN